MHSPDNQPELPFDGPGEMIEYSSQEVILEGRHPIIPEQLADEVAWERENSNPYAQGKRERYGR